MPRLATDRKEPMQRTVTRAVVVGIRSLVLVEVPERSLGQRDMSLLTMEI